MMVISMIILPFLFKTGDKLIAEKQIEIESRQPDVDMGSTYRSVHAGPHFPIFRSVNP